MTRTFKIALLEDNNKLLERLVEYILKLQNVDTSEDQYRFLKKENK